MRSERQQGWIVNWGLIIATKTIILNLAEIQSKGRPLSEYLISGWQIDAFSIPNLHFSLLEKTYFWLFLNLKACLIYNKFRKTWTLKIRKKILIIKILPPQERLVGSVGGAHDSWSPGFWVQASHWVQRIPRQKSYLPKGKKKKKLWVIGESCQHSRKPNSKYSSMVSRTLM